MKILTPQPQNTSISFKQILLLSVIIVCLSSGFNKINAQIVSFDGSNCNTGGATTIVPAVGNPFLIGDEWGDPTIVDANGEITGGNASYDIFGIWAKVVTKVVGGVQGADLQLAIQRGAQGNSTFSIFLNVDCNVLTGDSSKDRKGADYVINFNMDKVGNTLVDNKFHVWNGSS